MHSNRLLVMCIFTFLFFLAEIIVGYMVNSLALVADAFHMLSDLLSLVVAFIAIKLSQRKYSDSMTFGWIRAEILGGLFNGILLLSLCFSIVVEGIQRFFERTEINRPVLLLIVASIGLAFNIIGLFLFGGHASHSHSHSHAHKKKDELVPLPSLETPQIVPKKEEKEEKEKETSAAMHSVFLHVLGDAFGSIAVIASALFIWLTDFSWRFYVDPIISILLSLILVWSSLRLIKSTSLILLHRVPQSVELHELREAITKIPGVLGIHEFHVWPLDEKRNVCTIHLTTPEKIEFMQVGKEIKDTLHRFGIHSATIQPEFVGEADTEECIMSCKEQTCRKRICCTDN